MSPCRPKPGLGSASPSGAMARTIDCAGLCAHRASQTSPHPGLTHIFRTHITSMTIVYITINSNYKKIVCKNNMLVEQNLTAIYAKKIQNFMFYPQVWRLWPDLRGLDKKLCV